MKLKAKIEILPEAQQKLWPYLADVPKDFVLYGGTAIALRYGHRQSIDFDFFTSNQQLDLLEVGTSLRCMEEFQYHYLKHSGEQIDFTVKVGAQTVQLTFLSNRDIVAGSIFAPDHTTDTNIKVASALDLMACKLLALHNRSEAKDFIDLAELIKQGVKLQKGFEAAFAIAKLSRLGVGQLMLHNLAEDLKSKSVASVISASNEPELAVKANETREILKEAASALKLERVAKTTLKAVKTIERTQGLGL